MRGPFQETRRIPHALQSLPPNPSGDKWKVVLIPNNGDEVSCPPGKTISAAMKNAEALLDSQFPGHTL